MNKYQEAFEILKLLLFKTLAKEDYDKAMNNIYIIQELVDKATPRVE
jgi:hypothetical protein